MKNVAIGVFVAIVIVVGIPVLFVLGFLGNGCSTAQKEFNPDAMLYKYEWFKDQSAAIQKMDTDVANFQQRKDSLKEKYAIYGEAAKWPVDIRLTYNKEVQTADDDRLAIVSQRNNLVKEYNAASSKFNWSPFQTKSDKPSQTFEIAK